MARTTAAKQQPAETLTGYLRRILKEKAKLPRPAKPPHGLEKLEEQIDGCLSTARHMDRDGAWPRLRPKVTRASRPR
jgi:hypothetical protein